MSKAKNAVIVATAVEIHCSRPVRPSGHPPCLTQG